MKMNEWSYIGDGVYANPDPSGVWLHANDHLNPTDKIYLELSVLEALLLQAKQIYHKNDKGKLNDL